MSSSICDGMMKTSTKKEMAVQKRNSSNYLASAEHFIKNAKRLMSKRYHLPNPSPDAAVELQGDEMWMGGCSSIIQQLSEGLNPGTDLVTSFMPLVTSNLT